MTEEQAMLRAICDAPAEDTVRLAYADWLDEYDRPGRAEFIRVSLEAWRRGLDMPIEHVTPTHRCTKCGALWVLFEEKHQWSLCSDACGPCCDNVRMGDQIEALPEECQKLIDRRRELLSAHSREWMADLIPGSSLQTWSANAPVPYIIIPGEPTEEPCPYCVDKAPDYETNVVECRRCDSTGFLETQNPYTTVNVRYRRGFIETLWCEDDDLVTHAERLFSQLPLLRVSLQGREPTSDRRDSSWGWYKRFLGSRFSGEESELPAQIWDCLSSVAIEEDRQIGSGLWKNYPTRLAALTDLSVAVIIWGRAKVRLRTLERAGAA